MRRGKKGRKRERTIALRCDVHQTLEFLKGLLNCEDMIGFSELLESMSLGGYGQDPRFLRLYVQLE